MYCECSRYSNAQSKNFLEGVNLWTIDLLGSGECEQMFWEIGGRTEQDFSEVNVKTSFEWKEWIKERVIVIANVFDGQAMIQDDWTRKSEVMRIDRKYKDTLERCLCKCLGVLWGWLDHSRTEFETNQVWIHVWCVQGSVCLLVCHWTAVVSRLVCEVSSCL